MDTNKIRHLLGRIGVAMVFTIFGAWEIMKPAPWANYLPPFLATVGNPLTLITIHGAVMIIVGLAILTGFYLRIFAILAAIIILTIIITLIFLTGYADIVVRDTGLFFLVLSVAIDNERYLTLTKSKHYLLM
jgi:uncharacterized membrane protein YphA (DoxX/SURF4 family)